QLAPFLQGLIKAVVSSPQVALVFALAVGKDSHASDAYKEETERALKAFAEAESVAARKFTVLNPTEEDETAAVLRCRLLSRSMALVPTRRSPRTQRCGPGMLPACRAGSSLPS